VTTWYGFFAPQGTPTAVIARLNQALNESIVDESARDRLVAAGVVVASSTPQAFGDFMASEYKRWDAVREAAGIDKQ
jgi:tripartite-type tricarboxylate transporter receptor subunit TctC